MELTTEEQFDKFMTDQLTGAELGTAQKLSEQEIEFMRGYFYATKDLVHALVNAREEARNTGAYTALNGFIDQITKIMYDRTQADMLTNMENYVTAIIENKEE